jgi:hypothetical protein
MMVPLESTGINFMLKYRKWSKKAFEVMISLGKGCDLSSRFPVPTVVEVKKRFSGPGPVIHTKIAEFNLDFNNINLPVPVPK